MLAVPVYFIVDWPMLSAELAPEKLEAPAYCGNGVVEGREQCDDGNALIMDGCTGCMVDAGANGMGAGCGNGMPDPGEQCDDLNIVTGDGCSSYCFIETGFLCEGVPSVCMPGGSSASSASSDSSVSSDSSTSSDLSSSASSSETFSSSISSVTPDPPVSPVTSSSESSPTTTSAPSSTVPRVNARAAKAMYASTASVTATAGPAPQPAGEKPSCGDERILNGEQCDDGNTADGDGCSASCTTERGYICRGYPSDCQVACGDGVVFGGEKCDDGNNNDGDGCTRDCRLEPRWRCEGEPSACTPFSYCGNGIVEGAEQCDDENTINNDGCSAACQVEQPGTQ